MRLAKEQDYLGAARHNLLLLKPSLEAAEMIEAELKTQWTKEEPEIPPYVLVSALVQQKTERMLPLIFEFIEGSFEIGQRLAVLNTMVCAMPDHGLPYCMELSKKQKGLLRIESLGLLAAYCDEEGFQE